MDLRALLPAFATHLRARAAAPRTLDSYERTVATFLDAIASTAATGAVVESFLARPRADGSARAASTKRAELMALRAFFRFAGNNIADPTADLRIKRERRPDPPVAMPADVGPLFEAAACSGAPRRNALILALLLVLGLRVHELALDVAQLDLAAGVLRRVRGKGGTIIDFPLPGPVLALAREWVRERVMLGYGGGPLFPTARPSSSTTGRLSVRSLQRLVNRLAEDAGLGRRLGPHALRHGCATAAISLGIDVPTTAECMRHSSIATTQTYVHLARDARRDAFERLATLIPSAVLPAGATALSKPRNPAGNAVAEGAGAPVDIHPAMGDVLGRTERGDPASRQSPPPTIERALSGACFRSEVESSRSDVPGGAGHDERAAIQGLLDAHLERVRVAVSAELARALGDPRVHLRRRVRAGSERRAR